MEEIKKALNLSLEEEWLLAKQSHSIKDLDFNESNFNLLKDFAVDLLKLYTYYERLARFFAMSKGKNM